MADQIPDLSPNTVMIHATVIIAGVTFTTAIMVQTHKVDEIRVAADIAWEETRKQAFRATTAV